MRWQLTLGLCATPCVCVPFNHPPRTHLPLPASEFELTEGKWKQSEANCRAAAARHTQVEGEVLHAVTRRSLAVSEQHLADGCGAEMMHTDSTVSVSYP